MEEEIYLGKWWIIENIENTISGELEVSDNLNLHLNGRFQPFIKDFNFKIIHGLLNNGDKITLFNCYRIKNTFSNSGYETVTYQCYQGYLGAHLEDENILFNELYIRSDNLYHWLTLQNNKFSQDENETDITIKYNKRQNIDILDNVKMHIFILFKLYYPLIIQMYYEFKITEKAFIVFKAKEGITLNQLDSYINMTSIFFQFFIRKEINRNILSGFINNEKYPHEIVFLHNRNKQNESSSYYKFETFYFVYFYSIEQNIKQLFNNWLKLYDDCPPLYILYSSVISDNNSFAYSGEMCRGSGRNVTTFQNTKIPKTF